MSGSLVLEFCYRQKVLRFLSCFVNALTESCTQTADVVSRQHLRSASQQKMIVPWCRLDSYGRRCFAVAGPSTWNSLPDSLRDPSLSVSIFRRHMKTHFFCEILTIRTRCIRDFFYENALYKFTLHLLNFFNLLVSSYQWIVMGGFRKVEFDRMIARWMLKEADGETKITHPWKVSETDLWSQSDKVSQLTPSSECPDVKKYK